MTGAFAGMTGAFAGMTGAFAGMTGAFAGMTGAFAGMTGAFAGMTGAFAGMTGWVLFRDSLLILVRSGVSPDYSVCHNWTTIGLEVSPSLHRSIKPVAGLAS